MDGPKFEKERIIATGTLKERSILYLTHFAYTETELDIPPLIHYENDKQKYVGPDVLLTAEEVDLLWDKINTDPNKKKYDELRKLYSNWTYYKEALVKVVLEIQTNGAYLLYLIAPAMFYKLLNEIVFMRIPDYVDHLWNEDGVGPFRPVKTDEYTEVNEKLNKHGLKYLLYKAYEWDKLKNDNFNYVSMGISDSRANEINCIINDINCKTETAKCYIHNLRLINKNRLPLVPFRNWLKEEEEILTKLLVHIIKQLDEFTEVFQRDLRIHEDPLVGVYDNGLVIDKLKTYQETNYEYKESDLEDIINTDL